MNVIVKWYAKHIITRELSIEDIPMIWRQAVIDFLAGEANERQM